jgi:hypothetical protein
VRRGGNNVTFNDIGDCTLQSIHPVLVTARGSMEANAPARDGARARWAGLRD